MEKEKISEFTRRISQCNKSGLTLITYEILFAFLEDTEESYKKNKHEEFRRGIQKASACLNRLMDTLDFRYEISREIYPIYRFCRDELAMAVVKNEIESLPVIEKILRDLYEAFQKVSEEDHSQVQMKNSEKVIAGMTYQGSSLTENYAIGEENRGFLA